MDLNVAYVHYAKYGQLENFSDRSDECASTLFLLIYKSRLRGGLICGTPHIHFYIQYTLNAFIVCILLEINIFPVKLEFLSKS